MLITWISIVVAVVGLGFAGFIASKILKQKVEDKGAETIASYIYQG